MAIIFPGNYVERLNAYSSAKTDEDGNVTSSAANRQGVEAIPGLNFFCAVGVLEVPTAGVAASTGSMLKVLSPDMRSDDKPRLDQDMVIPDTAEVYSVAIRGVNVKDHSAASVALAPATASAGTAFQANLQTSITSAATTFSLVSSGRTTFTGFDAAQTQTISGDTTIYLNHDTANSSIVPLNTDDQAAVIIEVCYFLEAAAPTEDDVNLPYKTEAGSS